MTVAIERISAVSEEPGTAALPSAPAVLRRPQPSVDDLVAGVLAGDRAMLGRAITLIESRNPKHQQLAAELSLKLFPHSGNAFRIGITGVPGVGKSTFIEAFGCNLIEAGKKVAVLAVDPTSPLTGGSILGDKTRMARLSVQENAFIRPSPSGGTLGGVTRTTRQTIVVCEAAGFDVILVETVGAGQSEVAVSDMTDFFLVLDAAWGRRRAAGDQEGRARNRRHDRRQQGGRRQRDPRQAGGRPLPQRPAHHATAQPELGAAGDYVQRLAEHRHRSRSGRSSRNIAKS